MTVVNVKYENLTDRNDFEVVVFTHNQDPNAIDSPFVAWKVLKAQTSAEFQYPYDVSVGATWWDDGVTSHSGPFPADQGDSWRMDMDTPESSPDMSKLALPPNQGGTIVIKNAKPSGWAGRPFDFGLYKSGNLLVTQKGVGIGSQADFALTPKLFFGVVSQMTVGQIFKSLTIIQANYEVDLSDFSTGLTIQLTRNPASGQYSFSALNSEQYRQYKHMLYDDANVGRPISWLPEKRAKKRPHPY